MLQRSLRSAAIIASRRSRTPGSSSPRFDAASGVAPILIATVRKTAARLQRPGFRDEGRDAHAPPKPCPGGEEYPPRLQPLGRCGRDRRSAASGQNRRRRRRRSPNPAAETGRPARREARPGPGHRSKGNHSRVATPRRRCQMSIRHGPRRSRWSGSEAGEPRAVISGGGNQVGGH